MTAKQSRPGGLQRRGGTGVIEFARHPSHACGDLGKVNGPLNAGRGELPGAAGFTQRFARTQQRLRRDASPVRALAADELALDHRERQAAAAQAAGE